MNKVKTDLDKILKKAERQFDGKLYPTTCPMALASSVLGYNWEYDEDKEEFLNDKDKLVFLGELIGYNGCEWDIFRLEKKEV